MRAYHLLSKKRSVLLVCLLSLLLLASFALSAGAVTADTVYDTMNTLFTMDPNEMSGREGTVASDYTWYISNANTIADHSLKDYTGKSIKLNPASFTITDTVGSLAENTAVLVGGDFYFSAFPSTPYASPNSTDSPDPTSPNFSSQSVLTWIGKGSNGTTYYDGIRIDSEGNLYCGSQDEKIGVKLDKDTWYNLKVLYVPEDRVAEIWVNGARVASVYCPTRTSSTSIRFFDTKYNFTAYVKNVEVAAAKGTYHLDTTKELSADFISYQTTKPSGGSFDLRLIAGIDSLVYDNFGYEVLKLTKNQSGDTVSTKFTGTDTKAYSSIYGGNTAYSIKEHFGYNYACLGTLTGLNQSESFELVIFPYTVSGSGDKLYGDPILLKHAANATDADGYPALDVIEDTSSLDIKVAEDTYIYKGIPSQTAGSDALMYMRNDSTPTGGMYRAAYLKFTVPAETANNLSSMTNAYLRVNIYDFEPLTGSAANRVAVPLCIYGAPTNWSESTLSYNTLYNGSSASSARGELIDTINPENYTLSPEPETINTYIMFDVLDYIKKQPKNTDGSITVAFCITQEDGHSEARMIFLYSKEAGHSTSPFLRFESSLYGHSIETTKKNNRGDEPLSYAEELLDEWFDGGLYDAIYGAPENAADTLNPTGYGATSATGDFTEELPWVSDRVWTRVSSINGTNYIVDSSKWQSARFARTLSTLGTSTANAFLSSSYAATTSTYDVYGGITGTSIHGSATGYFHVEEHGGRPYIIDPLGNPYFAFAVNTVSYGETANLKALSETAYGSETAFFEEITASLKAMGINTTFESESNKILAVENGIATNVRVEGVSTYMTSIGRSWLSEGVYPNNNTVNVFDPDFKTSTYELNAKLIKENGYATNPRVFGYTADNELPSQSNILESYLTIDPTLPDNVFSYHTAWEWFARRIDKDNPTLLDYYNSPEKATLNSEFLGFLYATNYKIIKGSIEQADTNHMYMGSRVAGNCKSDINYLKAAGYYLDVITTNLYGGLNPSLETMTNYYKYAGVPFIVTEFFAKSMDAIDANGYMMANSTGAGFLVATQQDRADYYEHFTLTLLESKGCVGWSWYRFRDNDQSLWSVTKDGVTYDNLRMLYTSSPMTFMDEDGNVYALSDLYSGDAANWKSAFTETYKGEPIASNQNVNKGIYNATYASTVTVYTYNADGTLDLTTDPTSLGSYSYEVQDPASRTPADGTVLTSKDGTMTFTLGRGSRTDGGSGYTMTVLTTYKGEYIALSNAIKSISDHVMGLVGYLDAN